MKDLISESSSHSVPGLFSAALQPTNNNMFAILKPIPDTAPNEKPINNATRNENMAKSRVKQKVNTAVTSNSTHYADKISVDLKPVPFQLKAPSAKSVKLAAAFTEWEKCPLDLIKSEGGAWFIIVPLPPGQHPYRFIVDGQWQDDPQARQHAPNPFGSENAVQMVD